jgi:hypothetical protein
MARTVCDVLSREEWIEVSLVPGTVVDASDSCLDAGGHAHRTRLSVGNDDKPVKAATLHERSS